MKTFEYYTRENDSGIYIEIREGKFNKYCVWCNGSMVNDCINLKKDAMKLANSEYKEKYSK